MYETYVNGKIKTYLTMPCSIFLCYKRKVTWLCCVRSWWHFVWSEAGHGTTSPVTVAAGSLSHTQVPHGTSSQVFLLLCVSLCLFQLLQITSLLLVGQNKNHTTIKILFQQCFQVCSLGSQKAF